MQPINNKNIVLHSKEEDIHLLMDLGDSLAKKGFELDVAYIIFPGDDCVLVWGDNTYGYYPRNAVRGFDQVINISRDDFQTMFLLS